MVWLHNHVDLVDIFVGFGGVLPSAGAGQGTCFPLYLLLYYFYLVILSLVCGGKPVLAYPFTSHLYMHFDSMYANLPLNCSFFHSGNDLTQDFDRQPLPDIKQLVYPGFVHSNICQPIYT